MPQPEPTPAPAPVPAPPKPNKRRARRQLPKSSTKVLAYRNWMGLGPNIAVSLLDISETGVRLILKETLAIGTEFEINLESVSKSVKIVAQVVWVVPTNEGTFCVGAKFNKNVGYSDLSHLTRA